MQTVLKVVALIAVLVLAGYLRDFRGVKSVGDALALVMMAAITVLPIWAVYRLGKKAGSDEAAKKSASKIATD